MPSERGRWDRFYDLWARAVRDGGELPVTPEEALLTANVLDAARLSAAEGRVVGIGEVAPS